MKKENKKQLEEELLELKRKQEWNDESGHRYNLLQEKLLEKLNFSVEQKLELLLIIYSYVRIKKIKENEYIFETPIRGGWSSKHFETISAGIEYLLKKN